MTITTVRVSAMNIDIHRNGREVCYCIKSKRTIDSLLPNTGVKWAIRQQRRVQHILRIR